MDGVQKAGAEVKRKLERYQVKKMSAMDRSIKKKTLSIDAVALQILPNH